MRANDSPQLNFNVGYGVLLVHLCINTDVCVCVCVRERERVGYYFCVQCIILTPILLEVLSHENVSWESRGNFWPITKKKTQLQLG